MKRGEVKRMQEVRVTATGKEGIARFIGPNGLVCVDFKEPNPLGRSIYDPEELEPAGPQKQESEGSHEHREQAG